MESIVQSFIAVLSVWLPRIVAALGILIVGWIVALIVRAIIRKLLGWIKLDARLAKGMEADRQTDQHRKPDRPVHLLAHPLHRRPRRSQCAGHDRDRCTVQQHVHRCV